MTILDSINEKLKTIFQNLGFPTELAFATSSDRPEIADYQCNASFSLAKILKKAPIVIAEQIKNEYVDNGQCSLSVVAPGFLNFVITDEALKETAQSLLMDERLGVQETLVGKKIIIDFGGANIAKPLHVGHLRSAIIGQALENLAKFMGAEVIGDAHFGDWGLQMGLTIAGIMDEFDCSYYFGKSDIKPKDFINIDLLNRIYPEASKRSKIDEHFKERAKLITVCLQEKQKGYYDLWQEIRKKSLADILESYQRLGVKFDLLWGESNADEYTSKLLNLLEIKGLTKQSEGATIVEVKRDDDTMPMPPMIVKATSGADLYGTTDVATILLRQETFSPNEIWYVTDNRQVLHFEQVFRVAELLGLKAYGIKFCHIPFGTVNGADGKPFKTRDGGTMKLTDLINMITLSAEKKLEENETQNENGLAEKVGVSALKFGDLINHRARDYIFDIDKFASFEGKTGPYILYTMVRIKSILAKAETNCADIKFDKTFTKEEKDIITKVMMLDKVFKESLNDHALNSIAGLMFEIASSFATFYNNTKVLSEKDNTKKYSYLALCKLVLNSLKLCCDILGFEVPEKM